jgi:16S rRNA (adenine1518-N6/adenine1519-N6)-dimethyltransferase
MDPAIALPPLDLPALMRQFGLRPNRSLGQNFLVDPAALERVAAAAELAPGDLALEIGAGLGSLTRLLARRARRVVAVELDQSLLPALRHVVSGFNNVEIVPGDILQLDPAALMGEGGYITAANIPYYITSAIFRRLLEARLRPRRLVLTVQREVAERICARPGELSLLALSVQVYGAPLIAARIPAGAFHPAPKVDSAVVRVDLAPEPRIAAERLGVFFSLARHGFAQKRKTLRNSLAAGLAWPAARTEALLAQAGIHPQRRAETLSLEEWGALAAAYEAAAQG